ncbi:S8 family serine peptidase [Terribacillus sp. DMT04]|uniref:S8 family serine peptidase n=1 Tax=Terribacillus sp. DMT04 TaxID=2850441 RepID=UPI001C2C3FC6|nr:S8 family serine peptidase [Terribacillus sp. DMT04]QXE01927.1 S8 family serine peptidase [Terribacillus sp. DMT04]
MQKRMTKWLSILAIGIFLLSLFSPTASRAQSSERTSVKASEGVAAKVDKDVTSQFKADEQVTYLVKLKDQANTKKAAELAIEKAEKQSANLSAEETKRIQNSAVVSNLRATADASQANLLDYLKQAKDKGVVKAYDAYYIVNALKVTSTKGVMEDLAASEEVEKILPNRERKILEPTKAEEEKVAALAEEVEAWGVERVGAPAVWQETGLDGSGIVIGGLDTGVQYDHPALLEKYRGYNPADPDNVTHEFNWYDAVDGEAVPYDDLDHGTHTIGSAVGAAADGTADIGVAPGAKWIAVKAFHPDTGQGQTTDAILLDAAEWMLAPKDEAGTPHPEKAPDIINNSWGGGPGLDEWYRDVVQTWRSAGIVPVFSAGNDGEAGDATVSAPSNYPESISVASTNSEDGLSNTSSRGPSPYEGEIKPDIAAPGVNVYSSVSGSGYSAAFSGTSMAAPHVSGVIALLLQADSSLTIDEIETILYDTAERQTNSDYPDEINEGFGHGIVNAYLAVSSITSGVGEINGSVYQDGEDQEAAVIAHDAITEVYQGAATPLTAVVTDNVSADTVTLQYKKDEGEWQTVEAALVEGNAASGTYQAVLPAEATTGSALAYKFVATDFGGNTSETDVYNVELLIPLNVGYTQDFEEEPAGWTSFGDQNSWEWGAPAAGPEAAASGEKVYGTGAYLNNADATLLAPPVAVPEEGETYLQFQSWFDLESNYDYGHVVVSTDKENWEQVGSYNGANGAWTADEVNLSDYAGQTVYVGFHIESDGSISKQGWYIDDVAISDTSNASASIMKDAKKVKEDAKQITESAKGKKKVKAKKLAPTPIRNVQGPTLPDGQADYTEIGPTALPVDATVTVQETGRSVQTDSADGSYRLMQAPGDVTLEASAYGFHSSTAPVTVSEGTAVTQNFTLNPISEGTVTGKVTNAKTGEAVEGARVYVVEDAAVQPVETDENGIYTLSAYEGTYTLKITAASFKGAELEVTITADETAEENVKLEPFIGFAGEIGYDDGTAENAKAYYDAGNGWAVKFTLAEGQSSALVTGGLFRFWDESFPTPGGTDFAVEIYDDSGEDGAPGKKLAGPIAGEALRNGEWTQVDLSGEGVVVNSDFYIQYVQTEANPNTPALATDEDGEFSGRSLQYVGGEWSSVPEAEGNYMIRALVDYEAEAPVITSPSPDTVTKDNKVTVEGTALPGGTVEVSNNGEVAASVEATEKGAFTAEVELAEGENSLTAVTKLENGSTAPSEAVTVIHDLTAPELSITAPEDASKTNKETVTVTGTVTDDYLDKLTINGAKANVKEDGTFSKRILLEEGANKIKVVATDQAGNKTKQVIHLEADYTAPVLENVQPAQDTNLQPGETVVISFESEPGLEDATFYLKAPLTNFRTTAQATELPMRETEDGHYVGYWTATSSAKLDGADIVVKATDAFGNKTEATASGKVFVE